MLTHPRAQHKQIGRIALYPIQRQFPSGIFFAPKSEVDHTQSLAGSTERGLRCLIMLRKLGKVLLVRMDRIGDLVLTLPVDESLNAVDPQANIQWWIPAGLGFVTGHASPPRTAREVRSRFHLLEYIELFRELNRQRPHLVIVYHAPWWITLLLFLARIPIRAGPASQWHHFLFLNRRIKQKRSRAELNELEYNFRLTEGALKLGPGWLTRTTLRLLPSPNVSLASFKIDAKRYIIVHPGMGGSALNWPAPLYAQLIARLTEETQVVITGTRADEEYLQPIRALHANNRNVVWLDGKLSGPQLLSVLHYAKAVIAPSTGVMHLAASVGTPTLGLFSPILVQSPVRWGPQGTRVRSVAPQVQCPAQHKCLESRCPHYSCMQTITVDLVQRAITEMIAETGSDGKI